MFATRAVEVVWFIGTILAVELLDCRVQKEFPAFHLQNVRAFGGTGVLQPGTPNSRPNGITKPLCKP
ncbi:hypothetical protein XAP412_760042 [Xanthomonas phaseoli pv. phaseoli]|uniref:Secreted protein n=1 Tax=Xanthomonas campestris pv. phaseoli TaxID=317013 RepID=A0AB38E5G5_XANCH|nr:hypothetical protein XAP6984_800042 [Xanthomonas phaseoli pv. phaseoli]SON89956.1 hypothetical protein XAP412_760042 [Xanthomonas phaseoli pv. phaseoli]SON92374.1 hypothetical protein XAP7430_760042 [Xanthomonas phaseoli pv. phaseoli]SOO29251.1 hypothetical protein XAP6164_3150022 [Xanthomonas phaseoli pv. phaseoli]